jgi:2-keto-4-pentenoate hydratase/2-oxohepta-3-ene-1,7-dioic acid hydratase in catechol pathway
VVKICKTGKHISEKFAHNYYTQFSLGIDFTARDLQQNCKEKGLPWEISKSFENSAPISSKWIDIKNTNLNEIHFSLKKNDDIVQQGCTLDMIFTINQLISYISRFMTLKTGDLIYTGTPSGVGPVAVGDVLEGFIDEEKMFRFEVK